MSTVTTTFCRQSQPKEIESAATLAAYLHRAGMNIDIVLLYYNNNISDNVWPFYFKYNNMRSVYFKVGYSLSILIAILSVFKAEKFECNAGMRLRRLCWAISQLTAQHSHSQPQARSTYFFHNGNFSICNLMRQKFSQQNFILNLEPNRIETFRLEKKFSHF